MTGDAWERLQLIYDVANELEELQRLGREVVLSSPLHRRALEREIGIIGEACRQLEQASPDVAEELETRLPEVRWRGWRGLRNNVAHNLLNLDHEILWGAAAEGGPILRRSLEHEYGATLRQRWAGAPAPVPAVMAEPPRRQPTRPSRTETPATTPPQLRLRLMYEVTEELEPLAALGEARVLEPGVVRRAAERHVELIGESWIQLQRRFPDVAGDVVRRFGDVDWKRWRDNRIALAKNVIHPDSPGLWTAVGQDAPVLHAALAREFGTRLPDRHQRLQHGAPALSRRRSQARRLDGRAIGD